METGRPLREQSVQGCIDECQQCGEDCLRAALADPVLGPPLDAAHLRLLIDCAELCRSTARLLLGAAPHYVTACSACAEVCDACAQRCEQVDGLQACAEICRSCAQTCRTMASGPRLHAGAQ
ncbi:MAG: four-helix bundle copper-binding protein [Pseudomonadota bacterium]